MNRTPTRRVLQGLCAAALTAWGLLVVYTLVPDIVAELKWEGGARVDNLQQALASLTLLAIFGIPIAVIATIFLGYPMWRIAEVKGFNTRRDGLLWGVLCGSIISMFATAVTVLSASPGTSYGGSEGDFMTDGHLTTLGWVSQFESLVIFALLGACSGFVAVWVARRAGRSAVRPTQCDTAVKENEN